MLSFRWLGAARSGCEAEGSPSRAQAVVVMIGGCRSFSPCREVVGVRARGPVVLEVGAVVVVVRAICTNSPSPSSLVHRPTAHIGDVSVALAGGRPSPTGTAVRECSGSLVRAKVNSPSPAGMGTSAGSGRMGLEAAVQSGGAGCQ